ncbi:UBC core domain-containing protein [Caenorhabditis elegans]|uniref:UBC core domain-containing protein n=1 Tax=Caenorhabditis elegans TaxID=6239 RepID=Q20617_CAEEL|nr:UBC core domain-containing protein [Caenorhabditis elegans]CAA91389.2 UBC core domain-containing protein [Caenorhabditis elegans]|eukprot:NP_495769.2 UBiquitin Conjugating enzyme [Caenorhabditis elegans]
MSTLQAAAHGRIVQLSRIRKEIADLAKNKRRFIKDFRKIEKCKDIFQFKIIGDGVLYKNMIFTLTLDVNVEYPFKPPYLKFCHNVYHPNVDPVTCELCSPMLLQENWKPETTMEDVLLNLIVLLNEPDLSRPVNIDAAHDYIHNKVEFVKKSTELAKKWN